MKCRLAAFLLPACIAIPVYAAGPAIQGQLTTNATSTFKVANYKPCADDQYPHLKKGKKVPANVKFVKECVNNDCTLELRFKDKDLKPTYWEQSGAACVAREINPAEASRVVENYMGEVIITQPQLISLRDVAKRETQYGKVMGKVTFKGSGTPEAPEKVSFIIQYEGAKPVSDVLHLGTTPIQITY